MFRGCCYVTVDVGWSPSRVPYNYPSATLPKNWGFKESSISSNAVAFAFDFAFAFAFAVASALLMLLILLGFAAALPSHTHTHVVAFAKLS